MYVFKSKSENKFLSGSARYPRFSTKPKVFASRKEANGFLEELCDQGGSCTGPTNKNHEIVASTTFSLVKLDLGKSLKTYKAIL